MIAQPYALFVRTLSVQKLEPFAARLLLECEPFVREVYTVREHGKNVEVEAYLELGSTRAWLTVSGAALLINYGAVRQSIDYLIEDAKRLGDLVLPLVAPSLNIQEPPKIQQRRLGVPGKLKRLFQAVEQGEMTADEATIQAANLLDADPQTPQVGVDRLLGAFKEEAERLENERPYRADAQKRRALHRADGEASQFDDIDWRGVIPDQESYSRGRGPTIGPFRSSTLRVQSQPKIRGVRARRNRGTNRVEVQPY